MEEDFSFTGDLFTNTYKFYYLYGTNSIASEVILHGYIKSDNDYKKCKVHIKNLLKTLYATSCNGCMLNISEFEEDLNICSNIKSLKTVEIQQVTMKNFINNTTEKVCQLSYSVCEQFKCDLNFMKHIIYIQGLNQSALESFLLMKQIKGPTWLEFKLLKNSAEPDCKMEFACDPNEIHHLEEELLLPPLSVTVIDVAYIPSGNAQMEYCVGTLSKAVCTPNGSIQLGTESITYVAIPEGRSRKDSYEREILREKLEELEEASLKVFENGFELIKQLRTQLIEYAPDIIITYGNLVHPSNKYKTILKEIFAQYLILDIEKAAHDLHPKVLSDLRSLFLHFLPEVDIETIPIKKCIDVHRLLGDVMAFMAFITSMEHRNRNLVALANAMNLGAAYLQLSKITGCPLFTYGKLKRIECMLKYHMHQENVIIPEKADPQRPEEIKIEGALILKPEVGYYTNLVAAFDFSALYPSIIREYNIGEHLNLSRLFEWLTSWRVNCETSTEAHLQSLTGVIKEIANSTVGAFSSVYSSFYHPELGSEVMKRGREILNATIDLLPREDIIYGHTDSIFLRYPQKLTYDQVLKMSHDYVDKINACYKIIKIKLEGIFTHSFICSKIMYAMVYHEDFKRKKTRGKWLLKSIRVNRVPKIVQNALMLYLEAVINEDLTQCSNEIEKLFISDDPYDYATAIQLGDNIQNKIALRTNAREIDGYKKKDYVQSVVCKSKIHGRINGCYSLYEYNFMKKIFDIRIDKQYYRECVLEPKLYVFQRLVDEFNTREGKNLPLVELEYKCWGGEALFSALNKVKYKWYKLDMRNQIFRLKPFYFRCPKCGVYTIVMEPNCEHFLKCFACEVAFSSQLITDALHAMLRDSLRKVEQLKYLAIPPPIKSLQSEIDETLQSNSEFNEYSFIRQIDFLKDLFYKCKIQSDVSLFSDLLTMTENFSKENLNEAKYAERVNLADYFQTCD